MNKIQEDFMELLRAGLWGRKPSLSSPLSSDEWDEILELSKQQTVVGTVFDGISLLSDNMKPERNVIMKWLPIVLNIERNNHILNDKVEKIAIKYKEHDISPVMVKGQGIASLYLNPLHRQSGDIDIYTNENYKEACDLAKSISYKDCDWESEHFNIKYDDFVLEIHKLLTHSHILPMTKRLDKWLKTKIDKSASHIGSMRIPDAEFNCIFVFYHLFHHFMESGCGFRQLCDWCRCLYTYHNDIDTQKLEKNLNNFGMLHSWKAFGYVVVNYLGLNQSFMPLYELYPQKKAERIINLIFEEGNFGHYSSKSHYSHIYLLRKLYSFYDNMVRMINLASLFPTDAIRNIKNPWNSFERIYQDWKKKRK